MARISRWFVVLAFVLVPASVSSLGLGDIKLNSYLNERLDAEISISVSGADELQTLEVNVASREVFERFGVDRVDFLNDLDFTVERRDDGRAVVRVTSTDAIVEPFLTFLIEARSSGGRLLREYTVLLDPPLFLPEPEEPEAAPEAPVRQAPSVGTIPRSTQQPASPPPARRQPVASPTTYGPVRRNETLWGIAESVRPDASVSINQAMISLYNANPEAFDGNINRLRAGATLRVPDFAEMTRLSASQASAEVRQHNRDWSQARSAPAVPTAAPAPAAPAPEESRLELVPPAPEKRAAPTSGVSTADGPPSEYIREQEALNEELLAAVQSMRQELEETRRLIGMKDEEIAALQDRLAGIEAGRFEPAPAQTPDAGAAEPADAVVTDSGEPVAEQPAAAEEPVAEETVAEEPAAEEPAPAAEQPAATPPAAQIGSQADKGGLFSSIWTWIIIIAVALLGAAFFWRRRQEGDEAYESWASVDEEGKPMTPVAAAAPAAAAATVAEDIVVEEPELEEEAGEEPAAEIEEAPMAGEPAEAPKAEQAAPDGTGEYAYPFEDTIAGATGINLEQSDPLAEADFHMAYGLYDQAADLIKKAIERDPERNDLRMKLLDILFVWGRQDDFLEESKALQAKMGDMDSSEWERIAIMGRQICPDEEIFGQEGGVEAGAGADSGDLDFEVGGEKAEPAESDGLDFDLSPTGEMPGIDIDITQETIAPESTAEVEIEDLGLDIDIESLGEDPEATREEEQIEEDAVEKTEVLESSDDELVDETGKTEVLERTEEDSEPVDETGLTEVFERVEEATENETGVVRAEDLDITELDAEGETKELPALDLDTAGPDDETTEVEAINDEGLDLDDLTAELDVDLDKTVEIPIAGASPDGDALIDQVFGDESGEAEGVLEEVADAEATQEIPAVKPSDVTLSEVGTKLDLARAYIDMGDPDGARTILEEVVDEGDDSQKDEAQQLLEGLG